MKPIRITPKPPFDFRHTATSSGWAQLLPTHWDAESGTLHRVETLSNGRSLALQIRGDGHAPNGAVVVEVGGSARRSRRERDELAAGVIHMLRCDEDLSEFSARCRSAGPPWSTLPPGAGRILRSPTFFEDVVKTICTTNMQWGGTRRMVAGLVATFGRSPESNPDRKAFPTPGSIAALQSAEFSEAAQLGYRAAYVHELARRLQEGDLSADQFHDAAADTPELRKRILAVRGVGAYAAATLLMILGRYDELPVDSVFRKFVSRRYYGGEAVTDDEAAAIYTPWGEWKYLAYWLDLLYEPGVHEL